ncbi:MAG: TadE/TadG family type IV pilus assembly protein [Terriglobia bacterium]
MRIRASQCEGKWRWGWKESRGANMLEMAAVIPLLLLLTFAIIDFSTLFYVYLSLENGVSQATRYAVTGQVMPNPSNPAQNLSRDDSIKLAMRNATPTLSIPDSAFSFFNVTQNASGTGGPTDVIRVTVQYVYVPVTPLIQAFFTGGRITFTVSSTMKNEPYPSS